MATNAGMFTKLMVAGFTSLFFASTRFGNAVFIRLGCVPC